MMDEKQKKRLSFDISRVEFSDNFAIWHSEYTYDEGWDIVDDDDMAGPDEDGHESSDYVLLILEHMKEKGYMPISSAGNHIIFQKITPSQNKSD